MRLSHFIWRHVSYKILCLFGIQAIIKYLEYLIMTSTLNNKYAIILLAGPLFGTLYYDNYVIAQTTKLTKLFIVDLTDKYEQLTFLNKQKYTHDIFMGDVRKISWVIHYWISSGYLSIIDIIVMQYTCFVVLPINFFAMTTLLLCVLYIYNLRNVPIEKASKVMCNQQYAKSQEIMKMSSYLTTVNGNKHGNVVRDVMNILTSHVEYEKITSLHHGYNLLITKIMFVVGLTFGQNIVILILMTSNINSFMNFCKTSGKADSEYVVLCDKLAEYETVIKPEQFQIPPVWDITSHDLKLARCDTLLVVGKKGSGKTTFINGLCGFVKGVTVSHMSPRNYVDDIAYYSQNMKDNLSVVYRNIKEIMECTNDVIILKYLEMFDMNKRIVNYDEPIGTVSGGERMLLTLMCFCYNNQNKSVMIIDEPEQNLDEQTSTHVIKNIRELYKDKILIIISHSRVIRESFFWNHLLKIENNTMDMCVFRVN